MSSNTPSPGHTLRSPRVSQRICLCCRLSRCGFSLQVKADPTLVVRCREPRLARLLGTSHEVSWFQSACRAPEGTRLNTCCFSAFVLIELYEIDCSKPISPALVEPLPRNLSDRQERPTVEESVKDAKSLWQTRVWLFSSDLRSSSGHQAAP